MARISSETAALTIGNRYDMILIGARRARELSRGWRPKVDAKNDVVVTALREIEQGHIGKEYLLKPQNIGRKESAPDEQ